MAKETWVYLIKDNFTGYHKIGFSRDPLTRLRNLSKEPTLLPVSLEFSLIQAWWGNTEDERFLHKQFTNQRKRGEWFDLTDEDIANIHTYFYYCIQYHSGVSQHSDEEWERRQTERDRKQEESFEFAKLADFIDFAVEGCDYGF